MSTMRMPPTVRIDSSADDADGLSLHHLRHGCVLVRAHGELDLGTVVGLRTLLDRAGRESASAPGRAAGHVVCDLSGVTFLAAVGVGALAEAGDAARRRGAHLHLIAASRPVLRMLELCGLDRELLIVSRLADALDRAGETGAPGAPAPRSAP